MSKPHNEELYAIAAELKKTPHGKKGPVYERFAQQYDCSVKTLHEWLNESCKSRGQRKSRSDKGNSALSREEARTISALVTETRRQHGKRLHSVAQALDILRANDMIKAERIDQKSGEVIPMSNTAVERALRGYGLHPEQLRRPPPAQKMRSEHPNHVWQIDPSLCVLYYLPKDAGLKVMAENVFYKNKPENIKKIEKQRVWRYVITDHTSGWCYVEYVFGAESGENLSQCFINAMQFRGNKDPVHGVPIMVMVDPGSANTGAVFKNLCAALGVRLQVNKPGNPRAKGQVEGMNNIIETQFEGGLKLQHTESLEQLNQQAWAWMRVFNAQNIHRRHGMTRFNAWMRIQQHQLIKAPDVTTCKALTHEKPETRVVNDFMQISWKGDQYDLSHSPALNNRDTVTVARNPWKADCLRVIGEDAAGEVVFYEADKVQKDEFGFDAESALIGEEYKAKKDTPIEKAKKAMELEAMEATTQAEAEGKRKAKTLPFGGKVDPYKTVKDAEPNVPNWMERRGTESTISAPNTELRPFSLVEAAKALRGEMGPTWLPEYFEQLKTCYPTGEVPQEDISELATQFRQPVKRPALKVVGG